MARGASRETSPKCVGVVGPKRADVAYTFRPMRVQRDWPKALPVRQAPTTRSTRPCDEPRRSRPPGTRSLPVCDVGRLVIVALLPRSDHRGTGTDETRADPRGETSRTHPALPVFQTGRRIDARSCTSFPAHFRDAYPGPIPGAHHTWLRKPVWTLSGLWTKIRCFVRSRIGGMMGARRVLFQCVCLVSAAALQLAVMSSPIRQVNLVDVLIYSARPHHSSALPPTYSFRPIAASSPILGKALSSESEDTFSEKALPAGHFMFALLPTSAVELATELALSEPTQAIFPLRC